jgi:hypothetical protein
MVEAECDCVYESEWCNPDELPCDEDPGDDCADEPLSAIRARFSNVSPVELAGSSLPLGAGSSLVRLMLVRNA